MSNLFSGFNARLRGFSKSPSSSVPSSPTTLSLASRSATNLAPQVPPLPAASSFSSSINLMATTSSSGGEEALQAYHLPRPLPLWLNPAYARHIVKGNFMTLSARPKTVEQGEWIAHQVVEHYRNLWNFVRVVYEKEENGTSICNETTCPRMSAGANHSYTWLNAQRIPVEIPAHEYQAMMQQWISKKIDDPALFPMDPAGVSYSPNSDFAGSAASLANLAGGEDWAGKRSGFPRDFLGICQQIFLQMFRVYAHLYWAHFVEPFYHLNLEKSLNSCFSHFILTATALDLLSPHDMEPMQALIDLWAANGTFPPESRAYQYANLQVGKYLMSSLGNAS